MCTEQTVGGVASKSRPDFLRRIPLGLIDGAHVSIVNAMVISMASTTTIAISPETRDALRGLAAERGDTMDSLIKRLLRDERARRFGVALAERRAAMSPDEVSLEQGIIAGSSLAVDDARR